MGSYSLYSSIGFEQMQVYKKDLLFFQKLRASLMKIYAEKVDFSKYEDGIRSLLNNFITSEPVETIVDPIPIHDKAAMDKQLEEIDEAKSKAAYIRTRLVSELESRRYDDPMLYRKFSERIKATLDEYRKSRDENAYFAQMQKLADDFREGFTGHNYPASIDADNDAKAFYGIVSDVLAKYHPKPDDIFEEEMGVLSSNINKTIRNLARVDWRFNTSIHKKMNQALDDLIWDFSEEHGLDLPVEQIDLLLENIMKTAMSRY